LICCLIWAAAAAAPAGAVVSSTPISSSWVANGPVNDLASLGGRVYLGGRFSFLGPVTGAAAPLDVSKAGYAAGATSLEPGFPIVQGTVLASVSDGSGGWYVGGSFKTIGGVAQANLAHVAANGTVDTAFVPTVSGSVNALVLSGSALYVGGNFSGVSGGNAIGVAKLDLPAGSFDPSWQHSGTVGVDGTASALALSGNQLYVGGSFSNELDGSGNADSVTNLVELNAAAGTPASPAFAPAIGDSSGSVNALGITTVGGVSELLVGGDFSSPQTNLALYRLDTHAQVTLSAYPDAPVDAITTDGTGDAWIGGDFGSLNSDAVTRSHLAKYELPTLDPHWDPSADGTVDALAHVGSDLVVGGNFSRLQQGNGISLPTPRANIGAVADTAGALNPFTVPVRAFNPGAGGPVLALSASTGTTVLAGGLLNSMDGLARINLAAIDTATGEGDPGFRADTAPGDEVYALASNGSRLYAGGVFLTIDGAGAANLAQLDPTTGQLATGFVPPLTASGFVDALSFSADGSTLYAGGASLSTTSGFVDLGAFNGATGAFEPAGAPNTDNGVVRLLTVGGTVYVGGHFSHLGGATRTELGAFSSATGAVDAAFDPSLAGPGGAQFEVSALAQSGSHLYVGGNFASAGGSSHVNIAALDLTTGAADSGWFANVDGQVLRLAVLGNHLYAAGAFQNGGATAPRHGLAAFSLSDGGLSGDWDPQLNTAAVAHALLPVGNTLYTGYDASTVGTALRPDFAAFAFTVPHAAPPGPVVAGEPWPGQSLACAVGTFTGGPESYAFAWLRDGRSIPGAGSQTYTVAAGDVGHRLACQVTATNPAGATPATSPAVAATLRPDGPTMRISPGTATASSKGVVSLTITCPRGFTLCAGSLTLSSAAKIGKAVVKFGGGRFTLHGARSAHLKIKLSKHNLALLKQHHSIRCLLVATAHDASQRYGTASKRVTIRAPKRPKRPKRKHH
jgi:hypothetical protein